MFPRRVSSCLHAMSPLLAGIFIGIVLNLLSAPFSDDSCDAHSFSFRSNRAPDPDDPSVNPNSKPGPVDYASPDFEPFYVTNKPAVPPSKFKAKLVRPRYAATELGIKDKMVVCVITTKENLNTTAIAINKTLTHRVGRRSKVVFFMGPNTDPTPEGMQIVSFPSSSPQQLPFHSMKYAYDHYKDKYSWFLFVPDTTLIRPFKLQDFVAQLSISYNLYMGQPADYSYEGKSFCKYEGGVILSGVVLERMVNEMTWCLSEASSPDNTINIGRCVHKATNMTCIQQIRGSRYESHDLRGISPSLALTEKAQLDGMHDSLTVHTFSDPIDMYKVHRQLCEFEIKENKAEMETIKEEVYRQAVYQPGGVNNLTWPIGVEKPYRPVNRFDVIRWDYFTKDLVFMKDDFAVATPMDGVEKADYADILTRAREAINQSQPGLFQFSGLINGYKRFDPTRGMEYILDMRLRDIYTNQLVEKRAEIVRPLGKVEMVPMTYVTENTKVHLVLIITHENAHEFASFMEHYETICLKNAKEQVHLFIVFVYNPGEPQTGIQDSYALLKSVVAVYETKYDGAGAKLSWLTLAADRAIPFAAMDLVQTKTSLNSLILILTPQSEFQSDFLNRVRMNTIQGQQVYFPIAFYQYKPNLAYEKKPYPKRVELAIKTGHFDMNAFEHGSFYLQDYQDARLQTKLADLYKMELYDMFLKNHNITMFRASEPSIRHRFKIWNCSPGMEEGAYLRCLESKASGLASAQQLAMLIFEAQLSKKIPGTV